MIRPVTWLALVALLTACTQPVPPGAQVAIIHPPGGTAVGPDTGLLVAGQVWGPGFHSGAFGGDVSIDRWSVPMEALALTLDVDGRPLRRLSGKVVHRVRLAGLAPGRHEIGVSGGGLSKRIVLDVADPPPMRFVPVKGRAEVAPPAEVVEVLARAARAQGARGHRLLYSDEALLAVMENGVGWWLWRLPPDTRAAGRRLNAPPDLILQSQESGAIYPSFEVCGGGAFLAIRPGVEVEIHRLGSESRQSWLFSTEQVAQLAGRSRLEIELTPDALDALCFGEAAVVTGPALRDQGGGRYQEGRYAVLVSAREPMRLVLMPPEGGWQVLDMQGRLVRRIAPGTVPGRGRALARLGDGWWWVLLDGALAPLADGRPAVALPLPQGEAAWTPDRPLPYLRDQNLRPTWHLHSGRPPWLEVYDPTVGYGDLYLVLASRHLARPAQHLVAGREDTEP